MTKQHFNGGEVRSIPAGKFIMLCLSCMCLDSYRPLFPYRGYRVVARTNLERYDIEKYAASVRIKLEEA